MRRIKKDNAIKTTKVLAIVFAFILIPCFSAYAEDDTLTDSTTFQVSIDDYLTLTLDTSDNIAQLTPSNRFSTGSITANVATNNATGYVLTMRDSDSRNGLERRGFINASAEEKSLYNIPSVTYDTAYSSLSEDTWGYYVGSTSASEASYKQIPFDATEISYRDTPTGAAVSTLVNFGVKIASSRPAGIYQDTITFTAVANMNSITLEQSYAAANKSKVTIDGVEYYQMQDMNPSICDSATRFPSELQVADIRDNKIYWVVKLADGHCWMTQNLDFDIPSTALSSETTDLNDYNVGGYTSENGYSESNGVIYWTPLRGTIPSSQISDGTAQDWQRSYTEPYSLDVGNWYWIGTWNNNGTSTWYDSGDPNCYWDNDGCNYLKGEGADKFSQTPYPGNGTHGHVGNYYNWASAIAANDTSSYTTSTFNNNIDANPQNSICPAGWRLPTVSNDTDRPGSTNEFRRLYKFYGDLTSGDLALTASPLWFTRTSLYDYGRLVRPGIEGYYWSSTVGEYSRSAFILFFDSYRHDFEMSSWGDYYGGNSVRCVARDGKEGSHDSPDVPTEITTFEQAFSDANKTKESTTNKYKMQDINENICSGVTIGQEIQLVDIRDRKVYWVLKAADNNCWMTQNLDLDLNSGTTLVHETSDIGWGSDTFTNSWTPAYSTVVSSDSLDWDDYADTPYSADIGNKYWKDDSEISQTEYAENGKHGHVGNFYNWTAAVASNDTSAYTTPTVSVPSSAPQNSICPAGWKLPEIYGLDYSTIPHQSDFGRLLNAYNTFPHWADGGYDGGDEIVNASPLWFVRDGYYYQDFYWTNSFVSSYDNTAGAFEYSSSQLDLQLGASRDGAGHIRCLAR